MGQKQSRSGTGLSAINNLCDLCKGLKFNASPVQQGSRAGVLFHASSFEELRISALNGCHLCSLFKSGLELCRPIVGAHSASIRGEDELSIHSDLADIIIEYFPSYATHQRGERLEVRCGDRWVPLYLESGPTTSCLNKGYKQDASKEMSQYAGEDYQRIWKDLSQPVHPFCGCGKGVWEPSLLLNGQTSYSEENPLSDAVVAQIRYWIKNCINSHSRSCGPCSPARLPHRILAVGPADGSENPRLLTPGGKVGHYITLSYRWGDSHSLTTTSATLKEREAGIPLDSLPQTMRDAVLVARRLDIRYLWIDALCILQDSLADWDTQSGKMGEIYQNAFLNISAGAAEHSNAGFLTMRNTLEIRNCEHPSLVEGKRKYICPFVNPGDVIHGINKNALTQRGWIFPERLLSKRILHWSRQEIIWECTSQLASERHPGGLGGSRFVVDSNWNKIRGITQAPGTLRAPDIRDKRLREWAAKAMIYDPWYELVREYSMRILTKPSDKLPAISGLASLFLDQLREQKPPLRETDGYLAGLWIEDIACGLAWSVDWTRHISKQPNHDGKPSQLKGLSEYRAPSFSWASVDGPIRFHDNINSQFFYPEYAPKVLEFHVERCGSDAFGKVVGGYIKLRALVQPLASLLVKAVKKPWAYLWDQPEIQMRVWHSPQKEIKIWFSDEDCSSNVSVLYLGASQQDTVGFHARDLLFMLLLPVEGDSSKFYRTGLLTVEYDKSYERGSEQDIIII